ncbi:MAG: two-component sensor histidine kinase, partial [Gammaproteobacteria bacterium]|nr:two-component sensor histidine kinase [Gammaproteobacteria bacterium]
MEANLIKRRAFLWLSLLGLGTLMASLMLLSQATQYAEEYGRWYSAVLAINIVGVFVLAFLIAANLLRLIREYRANQPGSRLNARVLLMFVALAVAPLTLVFYFSVQFLNRGIDSYFNVDVETALVGALDLSRASLEMRTREYLQRTMTVANELDANAESLLQQLSDQRQLYEAAEFTVFGANRKIVATSSASTDEFPMLPPEDVLLNAHFGRSHVGLDTTLEGEVIIQAAVPITSNDPTAEPLFLFGIFPVDTRITGLTEQVQESLDQYGEVSYLRRFLKSSFTLTLGLALLISLLAAVWGAFVFSRRLIAPIQSLA